jgi:hypothetical protein
MPAQKPWSSQQGTGRTDSDVAQLQKLSKPQNRGITGQEESDVNKSRLLRIMKSMIN